MQVFYSMSVKSKNPSIAYHPNLNIPIAGRVPEKESSELISAPLPFHLIQEGLHGCSYPFFPTEDGNTVFIFCYVSHKYLQESLEALEIF